MHLEREYHSNDPVSSLHLSGGVTVMSNLTSRLRWCRPAQELWSYCYLFVINQYCMRRYWGHVNVHLMDDQIFNLFAYINMNSWIVILFSWLWFILLFFDVQIMPNLTNGNHMKLASPAFDTSPSFFYQVLTLSQIPRLISYFLCPSPESRLFSRSPRSF